MNIYREKSCDVFRWIGIGAIWLFIVLVSYAHAGAPEIREKCEDNDGIQIHTEYDTSIDGFAEVRMIPRSEQAQARRLGVSPFVIHVNPKRYYLSQYTQRWLYHRQCILIKEFPKEAMQRDRRINIDLEQRLDCRAIQIMQSDPDNAISSRQIQSIERDMERVLRDNRWAEVLVGPERRVTLLRCN